MELSVQQRTTNLPIYFAKLFVSIVCCDLVQNHLYPNPNIEIISLYGDLGNYVKFEFDIIRTHTPRIPGASCNICYYTQRDIHVRT